MNKAIVQQGDYTYEVEGNTCTLKYGDQVLHKKTVEDPYGVVIELMQEEPDFEELDAVRELVSLGFEIKSK